MLRLVEFVPPCELAEHATPSICRRHVRFAERARDRGHSNVRQFVRRVSPKAEDVVDEHTGDVGIDLDGLHELDFVGRSTERAVKDEFVHARSPA
jgi:hypothetical protein